MTTTKTLDDLREHLFATLDALRDTEHPMEIDRAKAIAIVAQTVVKSAKVEVDYIRAVGAEGYSSPFLGTGAALPNPDSKGPVPLGVRTHRLR